MSASTAQWLTSGYLLVIGILVPITAFLVQSYTTRQLFFVAMGLFSFGTLVAGISPNFAVLMSGRIVQAAGTALILKRTRPVERRIAEQSAASQHFSPLRWPACQLKTNAVGRRGFERKSFVATYEGRDLFEKLSAI